jgi:hypothetical protein
MNHYLNAPVILRSFVKMKKTLVKNVLFVTMILLLSGFIVYYLGYKYRENMNVFHLNVDEPSGLLNLFDIFRDKPKNVEIEIDNTKTQQHIISIPNNSKNSSSSEIKNDVNQLRQAPNYCRYDFGSDNENILEICLEDKPKCDGYNFAENNWGKCVIE